MERATLYPALQSAARIAERKASLPILEGVKIEHNGRTLSVTATDLETAVRHTIPSDYDQFATVLNARALLASVRGMPKDADVGIFPNGKAAEIVGPFGSVTLPQFAPEDYPIPRYAEGIVYVGPSMSDAVKSVLHAATKDFTRPALTGIHLHGRSHDSFILEACDGFRLAQLKMYQPNFHGCDLIIPRKFAEEWARIDADAEVTISLETTEDGAQFITLASGNVTLTARTMAVTYPDTARIIPAPSDTRTEILVRELADILKVCKLPRESLIQTVTLKAFDYTLYLDFKSGDATATARMATFTWLSGSEAAVSLNVAYLEQFVKACKGRSDTMTIDFNGQSSPMRLDCGALTGVVMPVIVTGGK